MHITAVVYVSTSCIPPAIDNVSQNKGYKDDSDIALADNILDAEYFFQTV